VALVPLTGIPLPFISYGGSSLVTILAGCGILLNISKFATHQSKRHV
ncbi:MAG: FtsW/RodA/SpoVE family cell cycle protein, partial [Bacteroidales bacterium]|nr:FtsW/RodA/SpoVE family cell cycle protein [Bacteroidales bacterium]